MTLDQYENTAELYRTKKVSRSQFLRLLIDGGISAQEAEHAAAHESGEIPGDSILVDMDKAGHILKFNFGGGDQ